MTGDIKLDRVIIRKVQKGQDVSIGYFNFPRKLKMAKIHSKRICERRVALVNASDLPIEGSRAVVYLFEGQTSYKTVTHYMQYFVETISPEELRARLI